MRHEAQQSVFGGIFHHHHETLAVPAAMTKEIEAMLQAILLQLVEGIVAAMLPQIEALIEKSLADAIAKVGTKHGLTLTVPTQ
jgi:hypothetical protein